VFARVVVDQSGSNTFVYEIPAHLEASLQVGSRVRVPVRTRLLLATAIELLQKTDASGVRPIHEIVGAEPVLDSPLVQLAHWIADYYCCPLEAAMRSILPQVIRKAETGFRKQLIASLSAEVPADVLANLQRRAPKQAAALEALVHGPVAVAALVTEHGASRQAIEVLKSRGLITVQDETLARDPHERDTFLPSPNLALNQEQLDAFAHVKTAVENSAERLPILLHGVTGSGKTEIYLQAIQLVLERGMTAIVLVPEISLTPQTVERFKSRFAATQKSVAVLHSHLSEGERHDEWHKIRNGAAKIVIGARSAIFAPLKNLGLIVVDEEHENSYKQEETPRYHARDVAVMRGHIERCAVLLGSATPSLESYSNASKGKYRLLRLTERVDNQKMPLIRVIDMRQEARRQKGPAILSERLSAAIKQRLERREQSILFLNRRGFNTTLLCTVCGFVCECPNCSIALTFHRAASRLVCHICGHTGVVPTKCPSCADPKIRYSGTGTEKVEEAVAQFFPQAVVRRMDADAMTRRDSYRETLNAFRTGKIDILVGTQMIAKGLHFPNVTLVGIINADLSLHLPDFRAGERTFQLLTQVAGRAGRGDVEGEVFVQSFTPFSPSIQFARHHDFDGFWQQEMEFREKWNYPPFSHMVLITIRSPHQVKAQFSAETLHRRLEEIVSPQTVLSKPAPAPLEKSHGQYRFHLALRTRAILKLSRQIREVMTKLTFPEEVIATVDVDPFQLL
jgi:primosomal protein N' (replication factor Y)